VTFDDLNKFIDNPKASSPHPMGFAGIQKDSERADVIAYLRSLSDSPVPLRPRRSNGVSASVIECKTASHRLAVLPWRIGSQPAGGPSHRDVWSQDGLHNLVS